MAGVGSGGDAGGSARAGFGAVSRPDAVEVVEGHGGRGGRRSALVALVDAALGEEELVHADLGEVEMLDLNVPVGGAEDLAPVQSPQVAAMQVSIIFF